MRRFVLVQLLMILVLVGCSEHRPPPVTIYGTTDGEGSGGVHIVKSGENLYGIAGRYHIVMEDLAYMNGIGKPYTIDIGQRLKLPPPPTYRVRSGDSLNSVARIFAVPSVRLASVNRIAAPYRIKVGQVLKLPRVTAEEASAGFEPVRMAAANMAGVKAESQDFVVPDRNVELATKNSAVMTQPPKRSSSKFMRPVEGTIISSYGSKDNGLQNDGVNIRAPKGAPVKVADNGVVVYAGSELKGSGNLVLVRHSDRWMTAYAHMDKITVKRGQVLKRGEQLGTVGSTGSVDSPQLHFEVRRGTNAVNPKPYL